MKVTCNKIEEMNGREEKNKNESLYIILYSTLNNLKELILVSKSPMIC